MNLVVLNMAVAEGRPMTKAMQTRGKHEPHVFVHMLDAAIKPLAEEWEILPESLGKKCRQDSEHFRDFWEGFSGEGENWSGGIFLGKAWESSEKHSLSSIFIERAIIFTEKPKNIKFQLKH